MKQGRLYSVALPIGNSADITQRSLETLAEVDIVAAEDSRKFKAFLRRQNLEIKARILSYHSHNEAQSANGLLQELEKGKSIALVTDAGTPRISDPGYRLLRIANEAKVPVIPVPGASSLSAVLSVAPMPIEPLLFLGFLSPKAGSRRNTLKKYFTFHGTIALFESVHRVRKLLEAIDLEWPGSELFIAREVTKTHEEFFWGDSQKSLAWIEGKRGEFVILVHRGKKIIMESSQTADI